MNFFSAQVTVDFQNICSIIQTRQEENNKSSD